MLILLSGWKGSGKDTAANLLVERFGFVKLAFASALKDSVAEQYGIAREYFDNQEMKEFPLYHLPVQSKDGFSKLINTFMENEFSHKTESPLEGAYHTPRSLCILEGSVKRSVDPNYWVKRATRDLDPQKNYVISDWRYRSEYEALQDLDPVTVRIQRFDSSPSVDPSERDLDSFDFDYIVGNKGSLEYLAMTIELLIKDVA